MQSMNTICESYEMRIVEEMMQFSERHYIIHSTCFDIHSYMNSI